LLPSCFAPLLHWHCCSAFGDFLLTYALCYSVPTFLRTYKHTSAADAAADASLHFVVSCNMGTDIMCTLAALRRSCSTTNSILAHAAAAAL
jgi:hypothetical protein